MRIPELLFPLVAQGVLGEGQNPVLQFWHETLLIVFPPGSALQLIYQPRQDYVYLVFGMTMGIPRDFATGNTLTTDDYGFYHSHSQMRYHWDPAVESIYNYEYPHLLEVTRQDPAIIDFYNNSNLSIIQDFSIWIFEFSKRHWPVYRQYMRGLYNLISSYGEMMPKEAKKSILEQRDLLVEIRDLLKERPR